MGSARGETRRTTHLNVLAISLNSYFCLPSCTSMRACRGERTILSQTTTVLSGCQERTGISVESSRHLRVRRRTYSGVA